MIFSHISDTHLGLAQYGLEDRENDVYDAFNQAVNTSIRDHVDFVIFAGDIFHVPSPSGTAILQMANALKRLKQNNIDSFFILGEHDISRIRSTPIPYVYHNLEFSHYIGNGRPIKYKDVLLAGFDKIRKNEIKFFEDKFKQIDLAAKEHKGNKILVMHQAITEANKFAGELNANELPKNFSYYAMGHLHDKFLKRFNKLGGPLAYPGSIEITTSEGVKETEKGFYEVDISGQDASPKWIKLDIRPQFSVKTNYEALDETIDDMLARIKNISKKPVVELKIHGDNIKTETIQRKISLLFSVTLNCFWKTITQEKESVVYLDSPTRIDAELIRLAEKSLGSKKLADFAIRELLPSLYANDLETSTQIMIENFNQFKKEKEK